jgi:hypothetical protein
MNRANLQLSPEELRLVSDPGWILTKNSIVSKVVGMMGELADVYRGILGARGAGGVAGLEAGAGGTGGSAGDEAGSPMPPGAGTGGALSILGIEPGNPKVSRGENYRGLPWVMLDYPRVFGREDVLAIRTMFWWGNGFNVTLHLKGKYLNLYLDVIRERRVELSAAGFHVGVHPDEWRHEHTGEVYRPFSEIDGVVWGGAGFLKLSAAVGLDRWMDAPELLAGLYRTLIGVLHAREGRG